MEDDTLHLKLLPCDDTTREESDYAVSPRIESLCGNRDVLNSIIDYLSITDMHAFSLSSKELWNEFQSTNYNWSSRIVKDFSGSILSGKEESLSFQDYLSHYLKWKNMQNWYSRISRREADLEKMLMDSIRIGRLIIDYETYVVFIGFPIACILFTILMMLYLNNVIHVRVCYIYDFICCYLLLLFPFLCIPGAYIYANTKKVVNRMWFLSHFNCNLIFALIKSDYVTRNQRESKSSVKYISNNEVVFTNNTHYFFLLSQILIVYFGVLSLFLVANLYQSLPNIPAGVFVIVLWLFTLMYGIAMHLKMKSAGIHKDDDKWEYAYFYFFVLQLGLLSSYILFSVPNLYWTLLPLLIVLGCAFVIVSSLFVGLLRVSANGIHSKRYLVGATTIALLFLLLFFVHLTDRFGRGKHTSSVLLCIEIMIPEICSFFPIGMVLSSLYHNYPPILSHDNVFLLYNSLYLQSLVQTHFDLKSRLRQLVQTESRLLRFIICSQLFKSFIQTPSIMESPQFPVIMELVDELRRNPHPDVIYALHVLHNTGVTFSPLLECIINEVMEDDSDRGIPDLEAYPRELPMGFEMHQHGEVGLPALNPAVSALLEGDRERERIVNELASSLFSLLEEASFEDSFNRL